MPENSPLAQGQGPGVPGPGFKYPPFTEPSPILAGKVFEGRLDYYSEPLSINGHAYYTVERGREHVVVTVYWIPHPLAAGAEREWAVTAARAVALRRWRRPVREGAVDGWTYYEYRASDPGELALLIGDVRRVAGIEPVGHPAMADTATGYAGRSDVGNEAAAIILQELLDLAVDPTGAVDLAENCLLSGPVNITRASEDYGIPKATLHRVVRYLVEANALVEERAGRGRKHDYYVNLRSEIALTLIARVLHPRKEDEEEEAMGKTTLCRILPYVEGVCHRDWVLFPSGYAVCRDDSLLLRGEEDEACEALQSGECAAQYWGQWRPDPLGWPTAFF